MVYVTSDDLKKMPWKAFLGSPVLDLDAVDGKRTIGKTKNVFSSVDMRLTGKGETTDGVPSKGKKVQVLQFVGSAAFARLTKDFEVEFEEIALISEEHVIQFCERYAKTYVVNSLFIPIVLNGKRIIIDVRKSSNGKMSVLERNFEDPYVWNIPKSSNKHHVLLVIER